MAHAEKITETVKVELVALALLPEEAATVLAITAHIGGDNKTSPRKHMDAIRNALLSAGVRSGKEGYLVDRTRGAAGSIYFADYPKGL
jgi:hypothetical protein